MPPRKKTADADGAPVAPTRTSSRIKAAATAAPAAAPPPPPAPTTKGKRARAASTADKDAPAKPANKRSKKVATTSKAEDMEVDEEEAKNDDKKDDAQAADNKDDEADDVKDVKGKGKSTKTDDKPKKMVTVLKRGAAPVDLFSGKLDTHLVYSNAEGIWDAMLNQTNVANNNNKFYVLQLLHPMGNENSVMLYTRWGRVGENGASQNKGPWGPAQAVLEFKKQFKAKAGVNWEQRVGMMPKAGKYTWLERDYGDEGEDEDEESAEKENNGKEKKKEEIKIPDSDLQREIQDLCRLIFNASIITNHLSSMNYDANKLPLGKLSKATILNGFSALKKLAEVIEQPNGTLANSYGTIRAAYDELSSAYYSIIPHDFGRSRPYSINNAEALKKELDLVDALGDMEIASKLISSTIPLDDEGNPINPMDAKFKSLGLNSMEPVASGSNEFKVLNQYVQDTHGQTHRHYSVKVLNAYRVERESETVAWEKAGFNELADGEHFLLWHGSRTTNFAGILSQGLRIAPPEAPVTGYMFGKGVYFADMMSKSANYCYASLSDNTGLLLLCDVAVKPFYELNDSQYDADQGCKRARARATKGIGRTQPTQWKDAGEALNNDSLKGCSMPHGPGVDVNPPGAYLQYNEYIVYDTSQIKLKYLLMVQM
ncbi:PARP-domain-containing protein [Pluteus cervinus]|uniref:PARP-domain-containing protein n=1 Tax=Pluteus cervinus TaxID=181527 RepID=A0ACD3BFJ0_9AGAR|nr:PARP-domain-containing protein [Pluteus cervinus]